MGSFQITYDDFTGGHYMGNRESNQPSNTWTGTNTTLDPRGNLIAVNANLLTTITTGLTPSVGDIFNVYGVFAYSQLEFSTQYPWLSVVAGLDSGTTKLYEINMGISPTPAATTLTLASQPRGYMAADQTASTPTLYYVNSSGNIYKLSRSVSFGWSETLVTSGTLARTSLYKYKYRLLGLGYTGSVLNRLYYSDPTMTTWATTDYYEFPGIITNVATRSNDFVVTTTAGIYSVTGVLGESVNIQEIYTFSELAQGMANPITYGRDFVYLNDYLDSMNGNIYAGLGTGRTLIGTLDLEADPPLNIGLINPGLITVLSNTGYAYIMDSEARWQRSLFSSWDTTDRAYYDPLTPSALGLPDLAGNLYPAEPIIKPYAPDVTDANLYVARADVTDIKIYQTAHTVKSPVSGATGSVTLAEYWHQKPMVVREIVVEAEYVATGANATISTSIIPVGAVDINSTVAPNMTSSTITAPSESTAGSTIIHRFFANNAGRAYGFKPVISHKGVRIRRVVCNCED